MEAESSWRPLAAALVCAEKEILMGYESKVQVIQRY